MGSVEFSDQLRQKIEEQNYTCPYSGKRLEIGVNATIDHKKPRSRFPELALDIENVHWVDLVENCRKATRTHEEYLEHLQATRTASSNP